MPFLTDLIVKDAGGNDWKLVAPLRYEASRECFEVPVDAETDFASIPKPFQWLIPRSGRYTKAAVLHDFLWRTPIAPVTRGDADGIFRRCLHEFEVPFLRRWLMWAGVRLGSLWKSKLRDRLIDVPQVLLVVIFPGLFVVAGGVLVLTLLGMFFIFESVTSVILMLVRLIPGLDRKIKPVRRPTLRLPR